MFKIKTEYYLEFLTAEIIKLLETTKCKITKNENGENVPYLEITEVHCIFAITTINNIQEPYIHLFLINCLGVSPKDFKFLKNFDVWFTDQNSSPLGIED